MASAPPRRHVLLIDDDLSWRQELASYLTNRSTDVAATASIDDGRTLLRRQRFDTVVLDIDTDEARGMLLAQEIGARGAPSLVIIWNRGDDADCIAGLEMGTDDYLTKPFSLGELTRLRALWRRMERARLPGQGNRARRRVDGEPPGASSPPLLWTGRRADFR